MKVWQKKRFWRNADTFVLEGGFGILLDQELIYTPDKNKFIVPTLNLAVRVAKEWDSQKLNIRFEEMPFTRACNVSIDLLEKKKSQVIDNLVEYGMYDLICYRAESGSELEILQKTHWDPLIAWVKKFLKIDIKVQSGIMPINQPFENRLVFLEVLSEFNNFELTALDQIISITGSLIVSLALINCNINFEAAWECSILDEVWQQKIWGVDEEATKRNLQKKADLSQAFELLNLLSLEN